MSVGPASAARSNAAVAACILLWLAATAWMRPLMLPDEGRYVGVAWEMLRSGDWLTPTLNGLPFFHKPPLFYWITAASMSVLGLNEGAARAAPLLGASLGAFALYLFVQRWWGRRAARLTLVALLAQPLFYVGGQFANLDMLVAGCITATIVALAHAALCVEHGLHYKRALAVGYALSAAGVLAKGLIGFVIPALVVAAWLLARRRWRVLLALTWLPGALLFAVLVLPWLLAMEARYADFTHYFIVVQHFKRFAAGGFNNVQPFWFYPAVLALFSLPFLPFLPFLRLRRGVAIRAYLGHAERGPLRALLWLWVLVVVLFFSIPQSKLVGYVLPAVPALAALMADGLLTIEQRSAWVRRGWSASVLVGSLLGIGVVVGLSLRPADSLREMARVLAVQRGLAEPVFMLGKYHYDIPFYARLRGPVVVVDDWSDSVENRSDNWHKELADAGQFAPDKAARLLIPRSHLEQSLCATAGGWVFGPANAAAEHPVLATATVIATSRDIRLWRVKRSASETGDPRGCNGMRSALPTQP